MHCNSGLDCRPWSVWCLFCMVCLSMIVILHQSIPAQSTNIVWAGPLMIRSSNSICRRIRLWEKSLDSDTCWSKITYFSDSVTKWWSCSQYGWWLKCKFLRLLIYIFINISSISLLYRCTSGWHTCISPANTYLSTFHPLSFRTTCNMYMYIVLKKVNGRNVDKCANQ